MNDCNIARFLPQLAKTRPNDIAVSEPKVKSLWDYFTNQVTYPGLSFKEVEERSNRFGAELKRMGLKRGDKVLVFLKPSLNFSCMTFGLYKVGMIPIFIDPGMGKKNLLRAIEQIKPDGLIAEPIVHLIRLFYKNSFSSIRHFVTPSSIKFGKLESIQEWIRKGPVSDFKIEECSPETPAAILFTSGGTGIPKGVLYTHRIFNSQVEKLKEMFQLGPGQVDIPGFPLFSLFTITMGMKSAIPQMNPSRPSQVEPKKLVKNILDNKGTFLAGSPAIWERVADYCLEKKVTLPSVKQLVMFGAPVSPKLHNKLKTILINGDTFTPYGATECLPVACISGTEILGEISERINLGNGTCVGRPAPGTIVKIAPITDSPFLTAPIWKAPGELGEICVFSETVTPEYVGMKEQTVAAKIYENGIAIGHRMGDLGFIDPQGQIWFCGRKSHKIMRDKEVIPAVPYEATFNQIPGVERTALIGPILNGNLSLGLVVQLIPREKRNSKNIEAQIFEIAKKTYPHLNLQRIYFVKNLPVDVRHNIKIDRLELKRKAEAGVMS